jgi:hypothetical protein
VDKQLADRARSHRYFDVAPGAWLRSGGSK